MTTTTAQLAHGILGYIGPGGGIALLGPLVGVLLAVVGALAMVALWPIRYMLRKARSGDSGPSATETAESSA